MTPRRELRLAVLLALVGGGLCLWGASMSWVSVTPSDSITFGERATSSSGRELWPALTAVAWTSLAAILVIVALRGWARRLVGIVLGGCGVVVVSDCVTALRDMPVPHEVCVGVCEVLARDVHTRDAAVLVTLAGGVALVAAGLLTSVRGGRWEGMGASYDAPGGDPEPPVTDKGVWDALDRGDDPTA